MIIRGSTHNNNKNNNNKHNKNNNNKHNKTNHNNNERENVTQIRILIKHNNKNKQEQTHTYTILIRRQMRKLRRHIITRRTIITLQNNRMNDTVKNTSKR